MSVCTRPMVAAKSAVSAADDGHDLHGGRRVQENRVRAHHHVHAGSDHGRGVDQRADRRGAFHGVRQPDVQRNLRGFSGGADEKQQRDGGERADWPARPTGIAAARGNTVAKSSDPNVRKISSTPSIKPKSPMRLTQKALLPHPWRTFSGRRSRSAGSCTGPRLPSRRTSAGSWRPAPAISMKNMNRFRYAKKRR